MEMNSNSSCTNINHTNHQCETIEDTFIEEISTTFGDDFHYHYYTDNNTSPIYQWDVDNIIIEQFGPTPQFCNNNDDNTTNNNNNSNTNNHNHSNKLDVEERQQIKKEMSKKHATRGGAKRKRQSSQVEDHIMAERRRRQLLSQMFISLSTLVPGLKKIDKTSVLGAAIKYMKILQEKVKVLEEAVAKRKIESSGIVKKFQSTTNNDNENNNNFSSTMVDINVSDSSGGCEVDKFTDSFSKIEVKISEKTLLIKAFYEDKQEIMIKLLKELGNHGLNITTYSVVPFGNLALDITIVAQIQEGSTIKMENFVRKLRSAL